LEAPAVGVDLDCVLGTEAGFGAGLSCDAEGSRRWKANKDGGDAALSGRPMRPIGKQSIQRARLRFLVQSLLRTRRASVSYVYGAEARLVESPGLIVQARGSRFSRTGLICSLRWRTARRILESCLAYSGGIQENNLRKADAPASLWTFRIPRDFLRATQPARRVEGRGAIRSDSTANLILRARRGAGPRHDSRAPKKTAFETPPQRALGLIQSAD